MTKLTPLAKGLIVVLIVGIVGGLSFYFGLFDTLLKPKDNNVKITQQTEEPKSNNNVTESNDKTTETPKATNINTNNTEINLSLDEWIGWKPIIDANMGLTTKPESIFGKLGIKVNINIINDATQSSNALIKGDLNAAGYTINRTAFLSQKFKESNLSVVMPIITNYSNGGDGIIVSNKFQSIESLVDAKIGVPRFSEAQTLVIWFINKSDLTDVQKQKIIDNMVMFDTPDDAAKAFFAGKIDGAATWQPYLSQAEESTDSHILFSTLSSSRLVMDGILFRKDFADNNTEIINKFIEGILQAESMYDTEFKYIKEVMPLFTTESDESIKSMTVDAGLANWKNNIELFEMDAPTMYEDMCNIWKSIGETVDTSLTSTLFDSKYLESLSDKYSTIAVQEKKLEITEEKKTTIKDMQALLTKTSTLNFLPDTAKFVDNNEASIIIDEFLKIARLLDGTIIQIEGNIAGNDITDAGQKLSEERAKTVAKYFISNGIDPNRIIIVGNGTTKQIGDNNTEEGKKMNRRTDVFFKSIE